LFCAGVQEERGGLQKSTDWDEKIARIELDSKPSGLRSTLTIVIMRALGTTDHGGR
jgi:hypothetical protein